MSRRPRRAFSAPLVMTLAVAPACIVSTKSGGSTTPPDPPHTGEPRPMVNPPPPERGPDQPPPRAPQPGDQQVQQTPVLERTWSVFTRDGKTCHAMLEVSCPTGATCNPPPPAAVDCPPGIEINRPLQIEEYTGKQCTLYYPDPPCPEGASCNPPAPQKVDCPTW